MSLKENYSNLLKRIEETCEKVKRPSNEVTLVAVTKNQTIEKIRELVSLGVKNLGENRIRELEEKHDPNLNVNWHFIGRLQSNKIKKIVEYCNCIHSVESIKHAKMISDFSKEKGVVMPIFVQVNVSDEESKQGVPIESLENFLSRIKKLEGIDVIGLMTMAPLVEAEETRKYFKKLKRLADSVGLKNLSMGMTNDFEIAIEEGATHIRIGSALFR